MSKTKQVIVVANAGWVFIGEPAEAPDENMYYLENAAVIRTWGTSRGLGEIALKGAQPETILDPAGAVVIPRNSLVAILTVQVEGGVVIPW